MIEAVTGVAEVLEGLKRVGPFAPNYVRTGLRAGCNYLRPLAIRDAPKGPTGRTAAAVRVRASRYNRGGRLSYLVQVGDGDFQGDTFYAGFVHLGWFHGSRKLANRKHEAANPWMRRSADANGDAATQVAIDVIADLIENGRPVSEPGS